MNFDENELVERFDIFPSKNDIKAMDEYYEKRLSFDNLSKIQIDKIKLLAKKFYEIELIARKECEDIEKLLQLRVEDKNDWMDDFEVDPYIHCYISENDIGYKEDSDNVLFSIPAWMLTHEDRNRNEFKHDVIKDDYHCGLFCLLYEGMRNSPSWIDILRIDSLYLDIIVYKQRNFDLDSDKPREYKKRSRITS